MKGEKKTMDEMKVTITIEKYEELVKAAAAIEIIKKWVANDKYLNRNDLKLILGMKFPADDED